MIMKLHIKVQDVLRWGIGKLKKAGVETPVLDAELLLAHSAILRNRRIDRVKLYAHPEMELRGTAMARYRKLIARRVRREPVTYILGHKEFYGLDFLVNRKVLIPRSETELLVEQAIREIEKYKAKPWISQGLALIDVGTGSGAIAVAVAKSSQALVHSSQLRFFATDISPAALGVARKNARRNGVENDITFLKGNLLEPVLKNVELRMQNEEWLIVANLPYLPTAEWRGAMPEVRKYEPWGALDGGRDGLKYYRELFGQLKDFVIPAKTGIHDLSIVDSRSRLRTTVLVEICQEQAGAFQKMLHGYFPRAKFKVIKDLAGRNRVVKVTF